jgi:lysophospholipase L1-like esterase
LEVIVQDLGKLPAAILLFFALMGSATAQVVALGASNTEGHGVSSSESYPAQLQAMLQARGSGLRVTNAGVYGDTTGGMLSRLSSAVPDGTKIVIVQFGATIFGEILPPPCAKRTSPTFSNNFANGESGSFKPMDSCDPLGRLGLFNQIIFI